MWRRMAVVTEVSGQPIRDIFKGQAVFLTREDETDRLSRNVDNQLPTYAA